MAGGIGEGEDASRFASQARASGLALPTARKLDPRLTVIAVVVIVVASTAVGFATNWFNVSRPAPNPLAELPGCGGGGTTLTVATEADGSSALAGTWSSLATAFGAATGNCLTVASSASSVGFSALSSLSLDALIGPTVPSAATSAALTNSTYDLPLFVAPVIVLVNTEGLVPHLDLSAAALAGAYLGTLTRWNASSVTATNPSLSSSEPVSVVYLAGANEANAVFTGYLGAWNATFRTSIPASANGSWPVGTPATDAAQVASLVAATPGAIGYVPTDLCPRLAAPVACAAVQTGGGGFVLPTASDVASAASLEANSSAASKDVWANVTGVAPTNSSAYPMLETTYAVLYRDLGNAYGSTLSLNASKWLIALVFWVQSNTSGAPGIISAASGFAALPSGFGLASVELTLTITYSGAWILLPPGALAEGYGESGETGETGEF
jgi:ABC-type phosphate transport system substrate-binding protein